MRRKEASDDYRYFPEPDMPPFVADDEFLADLDRALVELPLARKVRLERDYGLTSDQAEFLHDERSTADLFEDVVARGASPRNAAAWLSSDVRKLLNRDNLTLEECPLTSGRLAELLALINAGTISGKIAKKVLERVFSDDADPRTIVDDEGWAQISDPSILTDIIDKVVSAHPDVVDAVKNGDVKQKGWLMGQVMKATDGKAAPQAAAEILDRRLAT